MAWEDFKFFNGCSLSIYYNKQYLICKVDNNQKLSGMNTIGNCYFIIIKIGWVPKQNCKIKTGIVDGVVEMDETFVAESFKENHKKSGFLMPRQVHKRGREVKKCGISNEQVSVAIAQ